MLISICMFSELLIIDDVFADIDHIRAIAHGQQYTAYDPIVDHPAYYDGARTRSLETLLTAEEYTKVFDPIYHRLIRASLRESCEISVNLGLNSVFHSMTSDYMYTSACLHRDTVLWAGVIYLHPDPGGSHGTVIHTTKGIQVVDYRANRMVLYRADLLHAALDGFGSQVTDSRLTLNIFIDSMDITVRSSKY